MQIKIKSSNEETKQLECEETQTVLELKHLINSIIDDAIVENQRLIYAGRVLKDADTLSTYKIVDGSTVHLVKGKRQAPPPSETTTTSNDNTNTTNTTTNRSTAAGTTNVPPAATTPSGGQMPPLPTGLLNDPNMMGGMASMMSNPQFMDMIINSNPQLASMITPEMRQMMQSPHFQQMMSDPNIIQQAMSMSGGMGGLGGMGGMGGMGAGAGGGMPPINPTLMQQMMAGLGGGAGGAAARSPASATPPQPAGPPEEVYQVQLGQLRDMGFFDPVENVRALQITGGNVEASVEWLLNNPPAGTR